MERTFADIHRNQVVVIGVFVVVDDDNDDDDRPRAHPFLHYPAKDEKIFIIIVV